MRALETALLDWEALSASTSPVADAPARVAYEQLALPAARALCERLQEHHPYSGTHSLRVAWLALGLGTRLELAEPERLALYHGALLHDAGKVEIPVSILDNDGPLSAEQWQLMQRHVEFGERILGADPRTEPYVAACRYSHERWRGQGYPYGLAGEDIPLAARVVSLCDVFEAMTAPERRYVLAVDRLTALTEIFVGAGELFDPRLIDSFVDVCGGLAYSWPPAPETVG